MHKFTKVLAALSSCLLFLALGVCLAANPPSTKQANTATTAKTAKSMSATKNTAENTKKAANKSQLLAAPEQLSGTISFIGASDREVTLRGSNGVPYDFVLTPKSKVDLAGHKISPQQLASDKGKNATVRFVPTARGNIARAVQIT
jgi:hypothetical protein